MCGMMREMLRVDFIETLTDNPTDKGTVIVEHFDLYHHNDQVHTMHPTW